MNTRLAKIRTVAVSALITTVASLAWLVPVVGHADDVEAALAEQEETDPELLRANAVVATARLVADPRIPSVYYLDVEVKNTADDEPGSVDFEVRVEKLSFNPMARVGSEVEHVWAKKQTIAVGAGATVVRRFELPSGLSWRIYKSTLQRPKVDLQEPEMPAPTVSYSSSIIEA